MCTYVPPPETPGQLLDNLHQEDQNHHYHLHFQYFTEHKVHLGTKLQTHHLGLKIHTHLKLKIQILFLFERYLHQKIFFLVFAKSFLFIIFCFSFKLPDYVLCIFSNLGQP